MKKNILTIIILGFIMQSLPSFAQVEEDSVTISGPGRQLDETFDDEANLAFRRLHKDDVPGAITRLNASMINKYDNNIWLTSALSGRALGMLGSNNLRGIGIGIEVGDITGSGSFSGNTMFVVDGLPRETEGLRLSEVESITILKDVHSALLYGSAAVNGVVLITTKRGQAGKFQARATANYGISTPKSFNKFLGSAEYMEYYNQARVNDGLAPQFSEEMIHNYKTGNPYRYPSTDYYSSEFLRPFKSYRDLITEFSGGDANARYYANIGWNSSGDLTDFGGWKDARNNIVNVRGNVDLRVNSWIQTAVDATALYGNDRSPRGGSYWSRAASIRPHEYIPFIPFDLIDPENSLLKGRKNDVDGKYLLGGGTNYLSTPFGDGYSGGIQEVIIRRFNFNNRINFDLKRVTPGLSAHTNLSFDYLSGYIQTIANEYSVYTPVWDNETDRIVELQQHGRDARPGVQTVAANGGASGFRRRFGFYGSLKYDRTFDELHRITGMLLGFGSIYKESNDFQGVKNAHIGVQLGYHFKGKYILDFNGVYLNSVKLPDGNRTGFAPSLAASWLLHKEPFLSEARNIDFLKLRLSGGILKSDLPIGGFFYYDNQYATSGSYNWYEGTRSRSGVVSSWSSNPGLTFARRNEINAGLEGLFFRETFGLDFNFFYEVYDNQVVRPSTRYPSFYTNFIGYENFEKDIYKGAELGLSYQKTLGDWGFKAGINLLYVTSKRKIVDEVYDFDYLYRAGRPKDATFGLEAIGLFESQEQIDNSPIQTFGTVRPGDIQYKDQNGDGVINSNDEVYLRRWQAPFSGGLQLQARYKNVTLLVLGEGRAGNENFKESNYFWVDGTKKYTDIVRDTWTPETASSALYPRLSSQTNNNNHRRSSYWLYKDDFFNIRKIQLTYELPQHLANRIRMSNLDFFANTSDLYQFAPNRWIRELNFGSEPSYRTFSIGLKATFN